MSLIGDGTKNQLGPSLPGTYHAPYASCYRCPLGLSYPRAASSAPSSRARSSRTPRPGRSPRS
jgi:hypothetical protein